MWICVHAMPIFLSVCKSFCPLLWVQFSCGSFAISIRRLYDFCGHELLKSFGTEKSSVRLFLMAFFNQDCAHCPYQRFFIGVKKTVLEQDAESALSAKSGHVRCRIPGESLGLREQGAADVQLNEMAASLRLTYKSFCRIGGTGGYEPYGSMRDAGICLQKSD